MRNCRRGALTATALSFAVAGFASSAQAESLMDAIALAYQTNPQVLTQRSIVRQADELYYRTQRAIGPAITADVSLGATAINDFDPSCSFSGTICSERFSTTDTTSAALNITQPIYSGGRLTANIKAQEAAVLAARENLRDVEARVLLQVVADYVEVNRATEAVAIAEANVVVLTRQQQEAQTRFEVGASTRTDVAQAQSRLATAQTSLIQARAALANAQANYGRDVGQPPGKLDKEPDISSLVPKDAALAFDVAQDNNPTLRAAYLRERQSAQNVAAARSAYRPTVTGTVTAGYVPDIFGQDQDRTVVAGVRASVPLYTGLTTASTIRTAIEANNQDKIGIENQRRTLLQQIATSFNNLVSAQSSIASNQTAVDASNLAQMGTREEQQVGLRTTLDVLNAEQEYRAAQLNLVNARANAYTATVTLLNAMGKLDVGVF
ncbi:MAG TPA: TolC family outer membrane protein, partial [Caulobacteraceae bacterium]|nr:TolC family outer membrane protein [Caulobacteraceae bacterium]